MKSLTAFFFTIAICMQSVTAWAVDYSDFDSHCEMLLQHESQLIKKEIAEGEITKAEAEEEFDYNSELEQCVCFYSEILKGGVGEDFISYLQKTDIIQMDDDYTYEEIGALGEPKYPEGLDIEALLLGSAKACGIDTE